MVNVGHPEGSDELEKVLSATVGEVFPHVARDPLEDVNTLLVAADGAADGGQPARGGAARCPRTCGRCAARPRRGSRPRCAGGAVYTDDHAPVEWLIDTSIVEVRGERRAAKSTLIRPRA